MPPVTVVPQECVGASTLARYAPLALLWQQARVGAAIREGVMARYRYTTRLREEGAEITPEGAKPGAPREQSIVSHPRVATENTARLRAIRLDRGYYGPNDGWALPSELEVLHDDFLRAHCFEPVIVRGEGEIGLRFRPQRERRNFLDVSGTIWLDSATYLARRLELEYVDGVDMRGTVRLDFADIVADGATLRMPVGGSYALRPSRRNPAKQTEGKLAFTYTDFVETR